MVTFDLPAPVLDARSTPAGEAILAAATDLFYERGITVTGVDLLAERAGTTKRTIYQRFGSKEGVVVAYLRRRIRGWQLHLLDTLDTSPPLPPALAVGAVFESSRSWTRDTARGCSFQIAWAEVGARPGPAAELLRTEKAWMRALFTEIAGDAARGALVHQLYEGALVTAAATGDGAEISRAGAAAAALLAPRRRPARGLE